MWDENARYGTVRNLTTAIVLLMAARIGAAQAPVAPPPAAQNPSPMVETTRPHERLAARDFGGTRRSYLGPQNKPVDVWIPDGLDGASSVDLVVHFLGEAWLPEYATSRLPRKTVAAVVSIGAGSGIYDRSFSDPAAFDSLLAAVGREVATVAKHEVRFDRVTLSGFSAGHGAVRAILRDSAHFDRVNAILLLDGMHTSYVPEGLVMEKGGTLDPKNLDAFLRFARLAMHGEKRFVVTHSEIFPGTFASTTETADYLLKALGLQRTAVLKAGPRGMQQLSEVRSGGFELVGFAGNSAPDHIDHFQGIPEFLERAVRR